MMAFPLENYVFLKSKNTIPKMNSPQSIPIFPFDEKRSAQSFSLFGMQYETTVKLNRPSCPPIDTQCRLNELQYFDRKLHEFTKY